LRLEDDSRDTRAAGTDQATVNPSACWQTSLSEHMLYYRPTDL
jgi:hypothetical protein